MYIFWNILTAAFPEFFIMCSQNKVQRIAVLRKVIYVRVNKCFQQSLSDGCSRCSQQQFSKEISRPASSSSQRARCPVPDQLNQAVEAASTRSPVPLT